jgi:hypothetical protein
MPQKNQQSKTEQTRWKHETRNTKHAESGVIYVYKQVCRLRWPAGWPDAMPDRQVISSHLISVYNRRDKPDKRKQQKTIHPLVQVIVVVHVQRDQKRSMGHQGEDEAMSNECKG